MVNLAALTLASFMSCVLSTGYTFDSIADAFSVMGKPTLVWFNNGKSIDLTCDVDTESSQNLTRSITWWAEGKPFDEWTRYTNWKGSLQNNSQLLHLDIPRDNTTQNVMIYCKLDGVTVSARHLRQKETKKLFGFDITSNCPLIKDHLTILACGGPSIAGQHIKEWQWDTRGPNGRNIHFNITKYPYLILGRDAEEGEYICSYFDNARRITMRTFNVTWAERSLFDGYFCGYVQIEDVHSTEGYTSSMTTALDTTEVETSTATTTTTTGVSTKTITEVTDDSTITTKPPLNTNLAISESRNGTKHPVREPQTQLLTTKDIVIIVVGATVVTLAIIVVVLGLKLRKTQQQNGITDVEQPEVTPPQPEVETYHSEVTLL